MPAPTATPPPPRERLARGALAVALTLTVLWVSVLVWHAAAGVRARGQAADVLQWLLVMGYVLGVPLMCSVTLALGPRTRSRKALLSALLLTWLGFLAWAGTVHL